MRAPARLAQQHRPADGEADDGRDQGGDRLDAQSGGILLPDSSRIRHGRVLQPRGASATLAGLALTEHRSGGANGPHARKQASAAVALGGGGAAIAAGAALLSDHPRWAVVAAARAEIEAPRAPSCARLTTGGADARTPRAAARCHAARRWPRGSSAAASVAAPGDQRHRRGAAHQPRARAAGGAGAGARAGDRARATPTSSTIRSGAGAARATRTSRTLLAELTGAEAAAVVNNNAAAVLVALAALAGGREVIVSRGELVEIGGGFRIPDVMRQAGARCARSAPPTRPASPTTWRRSAPTTALFLKVHRSNFALVGFTEEVGVAELAGAGRARGIPVMVDLGSGALIDYPRRPTAGVGCRRAERSRALLRQAPTCARSRATSCWAARRPASSSGGARWSTRVLAHPLMRALRPDKMTLAALEATLEIYREGRRTQEIPDAAHARRERPSAGARARIGCWRRWRRRPRLDARARPGAPPWAAARCPASSRRAGRSGWRRHRWGPTRWPPRCAAGDAAGGRAHRRRQRCSSTYAPSTKTRSKTTATARTAQRRRPAGEPT